MDKIHEDLDINDEYEEGFAEEEFADLDEERSADTDLDSNALTDVPEDNQRNQGVNPAENHINILDTATFPIKCQVGEVNLSFQEISNLKIGDTIDFIKWPGVVKLHLNNLIFAEGYLVEVGSMLGVKITSIGAK